MLVVGIWQRVLQVSYAIISLPQIPGCRLGEPLTNNLRILAISSQLPIAGEPTRGRAVYQTLRELATLAELTVVSPVAIYPRTGLPRSYLYHEPDDTFQPPGLAVRYVRYKVLPGISRPFNGFLCGNALGRAIRDAPFDLVLSYWLYPDAFGAWRWAKSRGLPLVAGSRGSDLKVRDFVSRALTKWVVRRADRLLTVSKDLAAVAVDEFGATSAHTAVIPNGCDTSIFHPGSRNEARARLRFAPSGPVVLFVGRLVREKGLVELVHAAKLLGGARSGLRLVLVGDGPLRRDLGLLARELGVDVLFAGALPPEDVARWMLAADVVTLPSYSEGHPNAVVEALACGRPVVATPVGGVAEIADPASMVLVKPRDAESLAAGLDEALNESWDERKIAGLYGRSWSKVAADTYFQCELAVRDATL